MVTDIGENWDDVRKKLVGDGSVFDTIYKPRGNNHVYLNHRICPGSD